VADFRDPWSRAPWREDRKRFAVSAAAVLERHVIRQADHIIFVARGNRDDFANHYGAQVAAKLCVVPNGCDTSEIDALPRPAVDQNGAFVLLHAGSLYAGRTPVPVFRAVAAAVRDGLIDRRRFKLRFLGYNGSELTASCHDLGIEDLVEFLPRVPRHESLLAMLSASALLLLQPGHTVSVPGKVYEYLAAGRPILALAEEGETADIVRASGIGVSVPSDRESDLIRALVSIMQLAASDIPTPGRGLYDGNARAAETVAILEGVVRGEDMSASHDTVALSVPSPHGTPQGR
jgi:glycosyltransferase involved in cell wall biosynthesis